MYYGEKAKSFLLAESRFVRTSIEMWCRASGNSIHRLRTVLGSTVQPRSTFPLNYNFPLSISTYPIIYLCFNILNVPYGGSVSRRCTQFFFFAVVKTFLVIVTISRMIEVLRWRKRCAFITYFIPISSVVGMKLTFFLKLFPLMWSDINKRWWRLCLIKTMSCAIFRGPNRFDGLFIYFRFDECLGFWLAD